MAIQLITAQEIKQRGIGVVDALVARGPVHIIWRNAPKYVILSAERYAELLEEVDAAAAARVALALEDYRAGRVRRSADADDLLAALDALPDDG